MMKRIIALILATIMTLALVPGAFAVPPTNYTVGSGIDIARQNGTTLNWTNQNTIDIADDEFAGKADEQELAFKVELETSDICDAIKEWYNYGLDFYKDLAASAQVPQATQDATIAEYGLKRVTGEFAVKIDLSGVKSSSGDVLLNIPAEYTNDGNANMLGFNDDAKLLFEEVGRSVVNDILTINIRIKDAEIASIANLINYANGGVDAQGKNPLATLTFTAEGITAVDVAASVSDTSSVSGWLTGSTQIPWTGTSQPYSISFTTPKVGAIITHVFDGFGYVDLTNVSEAPYVYVTITCPLTGASKGVAASFYKEKDGIGRYLYMFEDLDDTHFHGYENIVINVYKSKADYESDVNDGTGKLDKAFATVTKLVYVNGHDFQVETAEVKIEKPAEKPPVPEDEKPQKDPTFSPHDKIEYPEDSHKDTTDKVTDKGNTPTNKDKNPPVYAESGRDSVEHEADKAKEELKKDYEENYDNYKELHGSSGDIGTDNENDVEFHSERRLEVRNKDTYIDMASGGVDNSKVVADNINRNTDTTSDKVISDQEKIYNHIQQSENIIKPADPTAPVTDEYNPIMLVFTLEVWGHDRAEITLSNGTKETKVVVTNQDGTLSFETVTTDAQLAEKETQYHETDTVYGYVYKMTELIDPNNNPTQDEIDAYDRYKNQGCAVFVYRVHDYDGDGVEESNAEQLLMLTDADVAAGKFDIDGTYYVDENDVVHVYANKFSTYSVVVAEGTPIYYTSSTPIGGNASVNYNLTFNVDGKTDVLDTKSVSGNVKVADLPIPTKAGYTFDGWYTDSEMTEKASGLLNIKKNTVLYGHFSHNTLDNDNHFAYVIGYPDGTVRPDKNITREEVATMFFRLLRDDVREKLTVTTNNFSDVDADRWSNTAISTMANGGYIAGRPDGTFDPAANITRAEFATLAVRFAADALASDAAFFDIDEHWAEEYILKAATEGWISGYPDGSFKPDDCITRAEAMTLVNNLLMRHVNKEGIHADARDFSDIAEGDWYYYIVREATNSHDFTRQKDGYNETWSAITADKTWN